jgi:hypothetical protein
MAQEIQFSVTLPNKPGALAHLCQKLAATGVNLRAISVVESTEQSLVRFVAQSAARARKVLADERLPFSETDVLVVVMSHKPGALGEAAGKLANEKININYVYSGAGSGKGRATVVFGVSEIERARLVLKA